MRVKPVKPQPGQESVWDYPRPPRLESFSGHIRIILGGEVILDTNQALRILETSHPPTFYLPIADFKSGSVLATARTSFCEFKGQARYYDLISRNSVARQAAWGYPEAMGDYGQLSNTVSVYAHMVDACYINDELVQAQDGDFYGGWITNNIVGPFKGGPGTWGW